MSSEPTKPTTTIEAVDLRELTKRARAGDKEASREIRRHYADRPGRFMELADSVDDIARRQMLMSVTNRSKDMKNDELFNEATGDRLLKMETDLAGPNPSAIETMLAARIVTCWLDAHVLDSVAMAGLAADVSYAFAAHMDKLRTRAHDRLMKAFKTLAYVRRVNLNILLQVNHGASKTRVNI